MKVYLLDDVEIIEDPIKPTIEAIKIEYQHYDYSEDELKAELEEAVEVYKEELKIYNSAKENGFVNGVMFHPKTYVHKSIFVKLVEGSKTESSTYSEPFANRKMAECSPEEQIVKINERETRKRHIEHNKEFEDIVQMIRGTDYIEKKKSISVDEMVAFSLSLFENNVDYVGRQKHFSKLLGNTSKKTDVETVENFKKNFKKETFYKLIRYILTKQVHFGESNHVNSLTNISFYNAMQGYYKTKIAILKRNM